MILAGSVLLAIAAWQEKSEKNLSKRLGDQTQFLVPSALIKKTATTAVQGNQVINSPYLLVQADEPMGKQDCVCPICQMVIKNKVTCDSHCPKCHKTLFQAVYVGQP